jgi:ssDNA-binding Zn-finger/Zn-ribbon topoisomerase 1
MKTHTEPAICEVCGGPGLAKAWDLSWFLRHSNPAVCAKYLKKKWLAEKEKKINNTNG